MRVSFSITACALYLLICAPSTRAQDEARLWRVYSDTLSPGPGDTLRLGRGFIRQEGFELTIVPALAYDSAADIRLYATEGFLLLTPALREKLALGDHRIAVRYRALPFRFEPVYRRRTLSMRGAVAGDSVRIATPSQPLSIESIFGTELNKSGYIGRGFTVGSDRDLNINSGFRLQLSGKLSDDITVVGALTDENTPIQPEGNTRTIQELDKVFIKISSRDLAATLGDFNIGYSDTEFGRYNRKLAGVLGEGAWRDGNASASYASLKGNFHSLQFNGVDGVQGPYRLTAANGKQPVLVLAGTERVYVDGVAMVRGETNDYVIEYASGEITFTPKRLITSYSRITVDYEYAEREYTRSMVTASAGSSFFNSLFSVGARFIQESDDPENPVDQPLDDADRAMIAAAGDDAALATRGGAVWVGYDSARGIGRGQYIARDTLIESELRTVFRYAPGADSATWAVTFSFVGAGSGDYRRRAIGVFDYAGPGAGDYTPGRRLPLPRRHSLLSVQSRVSPMRDMSISGEFASSSLDLNRLSGLDGDDDGGSAMNLAASWKAAKTPLGLLDVRGRYRGTGATFAPIDRINDIEYNRKWDISAQEPAREDLGEAAAELAVLEGVTIRGGWGMLKQGLFRSRRLEGGLLVTDARRDSSRPEINYRIEHISSDDGTAGTRGNWLRQLGEARYTAGFATPRLRVESEQRTVSSGSSDSLLGLSQSFLDVRPGVLYTGIAGMTLSADVGLRVEDVPLDGSLQRRSTDILQQYGWTLQNWNDLSANVALTIRDRMFSDAFAQRGEQDVQTVLTRAQLRYAPFGGGITTDVLYEVGTERTSRLERVYLKVPLGQGNYVYAGDLNGNGIEDENEFEPTRYDGEYILVNVPTDELFPVIDLKSSLRLRIQPERFIEAGGGLLTSTLRALSGETLLRLDEKSEEENTSDIYLLRLSHFLNDSSTVRGFQNIRQDLFLFERSADFSLRLRFDERRGFSKYALANERSYRRERALRVKTQPLREIGLQADMTLLNDAVLASEGGSRARDITSSELSADFSYRPWADVEIGFVLSTRNAADKLPVVPVDASILSQTLRGIVAFEGPGRLRVELERNSVEFSTEVDRFPYELTDGRAEGESWVLRVNFDYRITSFMQATMSYIGRSEAERDAIHSARAEVKAFF
ncbi:MAG: hypothetical protein M5R41_18945 [Bacteroidia bacterium]|nr:hypothetical protein [Bacteroidia bacterium]